MDGNKDAAVRCFQIGKEAIEAGDRARAVRFLTKARRLDPSLLVDDLLKSFEGEEEETSSGKSPKQPEETNGSGSSPSRVGEKEKENSSESSRSYTEEQVSVVGRIKREKDYYQILGLERSCSVDDVRKAYRKLSLKVHPDKNKAPGAEEAFKSVSKAFQCLSNEETRKRYDVVGSDEPVQVRRRAARHEPFGFNGFYEADVDAEEIFRNFFFGGMAPATTQFGQFRFRTGGMGGGGRAHDVHGSGNSNFRMLIQVLPILFLILLNFIPSADPPYSLSRSYSHEHRVETKRGVSYFVKSGFEQKYPSHTAERATLELRVEREYLSIVSQNCRLELQRQQWGFTNETPHCEMLRKYESAEV